MFWKRAHIALLASFFMATTASVVRAEDTPAPATRTITYKVLVPEYSESTRTVYKRECVEEKYTAHKCEWVKEERTRTCNVKKWVNEIKEETRTVCEWVRSCEEKTIMKKVTTCKPVTCIVKKCVDKGHWECKEVPCGPSILDRVKGILNRNDCCEPKCEQKTRTVRCWVANKVMEECKVTRMERVTECVPCKVKVNVCKKVAKEVKVKVCHKKCVTETKTEKYFVCVPKKVAYEATRKVMKCVPHQEKVKCCKMVEKCVEKQVKVCDPCAPKCGILDGLKDKFGGLRCKLASLKDKFGGCGEKKSCCK
ncbi:MAG: hypothetical protein EXR99_06110 [Gemmataceae bacterium]|nr:hypothetical protein [Gemmataceae bacterium]